MSSSELTPPPLSKQDDPSTEVSPQVQDTFSIIEGSEETPASAIEVVVGPAITWKTWLYKRARLLQQSLLHTYREARKPIHVTPQYSPVRFTTGLSPVTLHFKGWGLCVYGSRIRKFHDSILRITVPINEEATIFLLGWGTLSKFSVCVASSIQHIEDFSISTGKITAHASLPTVNIPTIKSAHSLPRITVHVPKVPTIEINQTELMVLREYLQEDS